MRLKVVRAQENCGVTSSNVTNSLYVPLWLPIRVLLMSNIAWTTAHITVGIYCSSLSYSIQNLSWRAQRQNEDQRSHNVSLYCYYCLLLFLHSFISLYKLTNASSRFSTHPLAFFFISTLPLRLFHLVLLLIIFSYSTVPSSGFRQRRKSSWRQPFQKFSSVRLYYISRIVSHISARTSSSQSFSRSL